MSRYTCFFMTVLFSRLTDITGGHLIDGIFTEPTLEPGYNLVATIPAEATNLNVTELRHTNNYLAIRLQDGSFLLNGNYNINWSGVYKAVGTTFVYHRQAAQQLESIAAIGPLQQSIDIMVLYQEPNPGIVYRYIVSGNLKDAASTDVSSHGGLHHKRMEFTSPKGKRIDPTSIVGDEASFTPSKRIKKRKFIWKVSSFTICSKTCGGGLKTKNHICVREHTQVQVSPKRCHGLEKPIEVPVRCNVGPCPPRWKTGVWNTCSVTCGSGIRSRDLECVQEVNNLLTVRISDGACTESKSPSVTEICEMPICKNLFETTELSLIESRWDVGEWSKCSATCGFGSKTRRVDCIPDKQSCSFQDRPSDREPCDLGPCQNLHQNSIDIQKSQWLLTEWTRDCSSECGTGFQTRRVICDKKSLDDTCDIDSRPESMRTCSSDRACSGQWFIGPWTECSSSCDSGEQTREIICVTTLYGSLRVVLDMNCPAQKPETRKSCNGLACPPTWYTSEWSECSKSCDTGLQTRQVKCSKSENQGGIIGEVECNHENRPIGRRTCNEYPCRNSVDLQDDDDDERSKQIQNDPQLIEGLLPVDESCKDTMSNCGLVIQARLCSYPFYQKVCCLSCLTSKHEFE